MSHSDCARRYHPIPIHITCLEPITKGVLQKVNIFMDSKEIFKINLFA